MLSGRRYSDRVNRTLVQVGSAVTRLGRALLAMPIWQFVAVVIGVAALKSTFFWKGSFFYQEAAAFPSPVTHFSTNFLAVALHKVSGEYVSLVFLSASLLALAITVTSFILYQWQRVPSPEYRRIIVVLVFAWPAVLVVLPWIGNGTAFLPMFMVFGLLARRIWVWLPALVLATATHPEHAFVGLALLALLATRPEFVQFRLRALIGTAISGVTVLLSVLWLNTNGVSGRGNEFTSGIDFALPFAFRHGVLGAYTWWGMWWLVIGVALVVVSRRSRWYILALAIVAPAIMTAFTADYTRVFVGVTIPIGIAVLSYLVSTQTHEEEVLDPTGIQPGFALGLWFVAFTLLPNLIFMMPGDGVPTPGTYWVGLVENYVLPRL